MFTFGIIAIIHELQLLAVSFFDVKRGIGHFRKSNWSEALWYKGFQLPIIISWVVGLFMLVDSKQRD